MQRLEKENIVYLADLVEAFSSSEATIRRDLAQLERAGKLRRINGGAILSRRENILTPDHEIYMNRRMNINWEVKKSIAEAACEEIRDGECIFLDGGSSIVPMVDLLKNRRLRIVTNNHLILGRLGENIKAEVIAIGGSFMNLYSMSVGSDAITQVNNYNYDRCFISCTGFDISKNMAYLNEYNTKGVKEAAMNNSNYAYLLLDAGKKDIVGFCKFTQLSSFDTVFCNELDSNEIPSNFRII